MVAGTPLSLGPKKWKISDAPVRRLAGTLVPESRLGGLEAIGWLLRREKRREMKKWWHTDNRLSGNGGHSGHTTWTPWHWKWNCDERYRPGKLIYPMSQCEHMSQIGSGHTTWANKVRQANLMAQENRPRILGHSHCKVKEPTILNMWTDLLSKWIEMSAYVAGFTQSRIWQHGKMGQGS